MVPGTSTFGTSAMSHSRAFHVLFPRSGAIDQSPFGPVIETLIWGLRELGHETSSSFGTWRDGATNIVLCPHLLDATTIDRLTPDTILYNLDQITPASPIPPSRLWSFRHWHIWDFSPRNQAIWNSLGISATIVPIGWYPGLERAPRNVSPDIDVLFIGQLNPRRKALLDRIAGQGLNVGTCNGVFGRDLDSLIARAKVSLNVHYYPTHLLETMRLSYLMAKGCAVVSERSVRTEVPAIYESGIRWAAYEDIPDACRELVNDMSERERLAVAGRTTIRGLAITPLLAAALPSDFA